MAVSKKTVAELAYFLDCLNSEEKEVDVSKPEIKELLVQLKKVDKKKINAILKRNETKKKKEVKKLTSNICYTEEEIAEIFNNHTSTDIKEKYSLKELQCMYSTIYKCKASSGKTKEYIVNIIGQYFGMSNRAKAFFN